MLNYRSLAKRFITAAGLAATVVGATALGGPAANAQPTPPSVVGTATAQVAPISPLKVLAFGHEATISFTTAEPSIVTVTHKPATARAAAAPPPSSTAPAVASGALPFVQQIAGEPFQILRQYRTSHELKLTGLTSNTAYAVSVVAETQSGKKHTVDTEVHTAKARVRVTLREIKITDDGDYDPGYGWAEIYNPGEPAWVVKLDWAGGSVAGCYPNTDVGFGGVCQHDSRGSGSFAPRNNRGDSLMWIFAEENFDVMPTRFQLNATADEDDAVPVVGDVVGAVAGWIQDCVTALECSPAASFETTACGTDWQVPQGKEFDSTVVRICANDRGAEFYSEFTFTFELFYDNLSYPALKRNAPSSTWRSPFGR